jgi:hypothetical protein
MAGSGSAADELARLCEELIQKTEFSVADQSRREQSVDARQPATERASCAEAGTALAHRLVRSDSLPEEPRDLERDHAKRGRGRRSDHKGPTDGSGVP